MYVHVWEKKQKRKKEKKYDAFDGMEEESLFNLIEWKIVRNPTMLYNLFEYTRGVHHRFEILPDFIPPNRPTTDFKDDLRPHFLHISSISSYV